MRSLRAAACGKRVGFRVAYSLYLDDMMMEDGVCSACSGSHLILSATRNCSPGQSVPRLMVWIGLLNILLAPNLTMGHTVSWVAGLWAGASVQNMEGKAASPLCIRNNRATARMHLCILFLNALCSVPWTLGN